MNNLNTSNTAKFKTFLRLSVTDSRHCQGSSKYCAMFFFLSKIFQNNISYFPNKIITLKMFHLGKLK